MDVDLGWCAPAACSLDPAAQPARVAEWDALFATGVRSVAPVDGGFRLELAPGPGRPSAVADLMDREAACCRFFRFDLTIEDDGLALRVSADPSYAAVVETMAARAAALSGAGR